MDEDIQNILDRYKGKLKKDLGEVDNYSPSDSYSQEYHKFRKEALTKSLSTYESLCNASEKILNVQPKENDYNKLQESIETSHLNITPTGAYSFSIITALFLFLLMIFVNVISFFSTGDLNTNLILLTLFLL